MSRHPTKEKILTKLLKVCKDYFLGYGVSVESELLSTKNFNYLLSLRIIWNSIEVNLQLDDESCHNWEKIFPKFLKVHSYTLDVIDNVDKLIFYQEKMHIIHSILILNVILTFIITSN